MQLENAVQLWKSGVLTAEQVLDAIAAQQAARKTLGKLALDEGALTAAQVFDVLERQHIDPRPFGEIAIEMGYLSHEQVASLLLLQETLGPSLALIFERRGILSRPDFDHHVLECRRRSAPPKAVNFSGS